MSTAQSFSLVWCELEATAMGSIMTTGAVKGVRFLRNTCSDGHKDQSEDVSPSEPTPLLTSSSAEPPPSTLIRNSVVRKALRRHSKGIKKNGSVSLDLDDQDQKMLLQKVCFEKHCNS